MDFLRWVYASMRTALIASFAAGGAAAQVDQEETDWRAACEDGSAEAFQRYLELHPVGRHAGEAFACTVEPGLCETCGPPLRSFSRGISTSDMY